MKYKIKKKKMDDFLESVKDVEKLLTDRISDLADVKQGMQARHAYVFYRNTLMHAMFKIQKELRRSG